MAIGKGIGYAYANVSTNSNVLSGAGRYYGGLVVNRTTGGVLALVYDATATATGTLIDVLSVAAGTYANATHLWAGVTVTAGIYVSAVTCTTASDNIIIFYGGK